MFKKKIGLIFIIAFAGVLFVGICWRFIPYHEKNDYTQIAAIYCNKDGYDPGDYRYIRCDNENDIKEMESMIRKLKFYRSNIKYLPESPLCDIRIRYKDGRIRDIDMIASCVMMSENDSNGQILPKLTKFYSVDPLAVDQLFNDWETYKRGQVIDR